jgi:sialic acid synthase
VSTNRSLIIENARIADDTDCYVIAEVGHNHQGDVAKAKDLFREARAAGVDAVKLQKRSNRSLYTAAMYDRPYDNENSFGPTYGLHREALEFGRAEYLELQACARDLGVTLFATAFDFESVEFLAELNMPAYKIASGDLRNIPLLKLAASIGKPLIISTGGAGLEDVARAYEAVATINPRICFLQCTATYPTQPEELNLLAIQTLRDEFPDVVVGLSDHYNGIVMAVTAYVLGARVVEKHFTLNHTWKGTDHALSLEPIGMKKMVRDLRRVRVALGDGVKRSLPSEQQALIKMGKSLAASRDLPAGHRLAVADIAIKSPGGGMPPYQIDSLVGRILTRPVVRDEFLTAELVAHAPPLARDVSMPISAR